MTQWWACLHREVVQEEVVPPGLPQHTVRNLPPFTNVSLLLLLSNPEGRRESPELLLLTDQDGRRSQHGHAHSLPQPHPLNSAFYPQFLAPFRWSRCWAAATSSRSA